MKSAQRLNHLDAIEFKCNVLGHSECIACFVEGVSVAWSRRWRKRFEAEGFAGLEDRPRSGRPRKTNDGN